MYWKYCLISLVILLHTKCIYSQGLPAFPNNFSGLAEGAIITIAWQPVEGPVLPDGYLILIDRIGDIPQDLPNNGTSIRDNLDFSDGYGAVNVQFSLNFHTFYSLYTQEQYRFRLIPYKGKESQIEYNTKTSIPEIVLETGAGFINELFFSEFIREEELEENYVEIYNGTGQDVDLEGYILELYDQSRESVIQSVPLSGLITQSGVMVISDSLSQQWMGSVGMRIGEWNIAENYDIRLVHDGIQIDILRYTGDLTSQSFTLRRSPAILEPNPTFADTEWQFYDSANFTHLGIHEIDCECVDKAFIQSRLPVSDFQLIGNFPNPFNPETRIQFILPSNRQNLFNVTITLYNILGQHVALLYEGFMGNGLHIIPWRGIDDSGTLVPSGYYFYEIKFDNQVRRGRMVLVR